jgi:hypothetical protein
MIPAIETTPSGDWGSEELEVAKLHSCGTAGRKSALGTERSGGRFRQNSHGAEHARTAEGHALAKGRTPKEQPQHPCEEILTEAVVATRDAGQ